MPTGDRATRVFLDTNVVLQGAFSRRSHVRDLRGLGGVQLVTSTQVINDEVRPQINKHTEDETAELAAWAFVEMFLAEFAVEQADVYSPTPIGDRHHAIAARALDCDWICTYNLKDFIEPRVPPATPPARTPRGLLRSLDPYHHLIEFPRLGKEGTLLVMARHSHPGVYLGEILESDNGTLVYTDADGFVRVRSPDGTEISARAPLPSAGYSYAFSFRYDSDGNFKASLWVDDDITHLPAGLRQGSGGRAELMAGFAPFGSSSRVRLVFGANYGFAGALHCVTGTDRNVTDKTLRLAIVDGTFDFHRSTYAGDLIERIEILPIQSAGAAEVIAVTLRSPNERVELPILPE